MGSSRCESPIKAPLYHLSLGIRPPLFDGNITITKIKSPCFTSVHGSLFYVYTVYIVVKPHCRIVSSLKPNVSPSSCVHHYSWVKSQCFAMCCQFFMGKPRVNKIYSCSKHGLLPCVHHFPWFKTPSLHVLWLVKAAAVLPATMVFNGKNLLFYQPPSTTINHHWRRHHQPPSTTINHQALAPRNCERSRVCKDGQSFKACTKVAKAVSLMEAPRSSACCRSRCRIHLANHADIIYI